MRSASFQATLVLALLVALGGVSRAGGCPPPDAYNDSTVPGCPSNVVDPNAPIDDGVPPTVDMNGDPIPYVWEESTAPVEAPTLTKSDPN